MCIGHIRGQQRNEWAKVPCKVGSRCGIYRYAYIPNEEVRRKFVTATMNSSREELSRVIRNSDALLKATLRMDGDEVAQRIEMAHQYYANAKFYNNKQALRMVIMLAYVSRVDDYCDFKELPSGKGYADILFFSKKNSCKPALLIELKWNYSSGGAIEQIKEKGYCDAISGYGGDILLVGINYDEKKCILVRSKSLNIIVADGYNTSKPLTVICQRFLVIYRIYYIYYQSLKC